LQSAANAIDDELLAELAQARALQFDERGGVRKRGEQTHRLRERRNTDVCVPALQPLALVYGNIRELRPDHVERVSVEARSSLQIGVMQQKGIMIRGELNVEFHILRAELERRAQGR